MLVVDGTFWLLNHRFYPLNVISKASIGKDSHVGVN